jgi:mannonate dehydratase
MHSSIAHGITFCTGSLGVNLETDLVGMVKRFGGRIHFLHLRNISREPDGSFQEADHLHGDVNMAAVMEALVLEQVRRKITGEDPDLPLRPDHGFRMIDDFNRITYPGYALTGRLVGLAQLEGLIRAMRYKVEQ